jgi:hypothetical protein
MAVTIPIDFYNTFILSNIDSTVANQWHIEESRINGGFNDTQVDLGVKAYTVDDTYNYEEKHNSLIYSGVINSTTNINNSNQFSMADSIVKTLELANGPIKKLFSEDTNLTIIQEDKVSVALINKNALFSADGQRSVTASSNVIGEVQEYQGVYGTVNPESFVYYGGKKYFVDRTRAAVMRLSQDGLTEISDTGMHDFFRDNLKNSKLVYGMYDIHNHNYVVSIVPKNDSDSKQTLSFDENAKGWTSRYSYKPEFGCSLNNSFYTFKYGDLWLHSQGVIRNNFYDLQYSSTITLIVNESPSVVKSFKTINYEGTDGWWMTGLKTDTDVAIQITPNNYTNLALNISNGYFYDAFEDMNYKVGFNKLENKYFAYIKNDTPVNEEEVSFGADISGVKGIYAEITLMNTGTDQQNLYTVTTGYSQSSY